MAQEIQKIADYDFNLELFLAQYANADKLQGIMKAANKSANDLEQALFEIRDEFYLSTAIGAQLDILGIVFQVDRNGLSDEDYRQIIFQKAALNFSGEPEAIISILKTIYSATFVIYYPSYPGKYFVQTDGVITTPQIEKISPAGVGVFFGANLVSAINDFIVDAIVRFITAVNVVQKDYIIDYDNDFIVDYDGNNLFSVSGV